MSEPPLAFRLEWSERARLAAVLRRSPIVHLQRPDLGPGELVNLGRALGRVDPSRRAAYALPQNPEIMAVGNLRDADGKRSAGEALRLGFHSDMSWSGEAPELTLLYAVEVPRSGGDTEFRSLYRMHASLDEETRRRWTGLEVRHEAANEPADYVHRWRPGDLLVWDNRAVLHRATAYDRRETRRMWRLSVRLAAVTVPDRPPAED